MLIFAFVLILISFIISNFDNRLLKDKIDLLDYKLKELSEKHNISMTTLVVRLNKLEYSTIAEEYRLLKGFDSFYFQESHATFYNKQPSNKNEHVNLSSLLDKIEELKKDIERNCKKEGC